MNLLGIYHRRPYMEMRGVCDAPYIEKGAHALASADAASEGGILACAQGRMRNAAALMRELGIERDRPTAAQLTLAVYRRWGEAYFEHIEGPVTTAVIDRENDMLLVSRDRMGECPLFYAAEGGSVAFADHPDLLIESGGETGQQRFTDVRQPDRVQMIINAQKSALRRAPAAAGAAPEPTDVASQLEKLEGLLERGTITQEEFDDQKRRILGG